MRDQESINAKIKASLIARSVRLGIKSKIPCVTCGKEIKPNKYNLCQSCLYTHPEYLNNLSKSMIGKNVGKYNGDRSKSSRGIHGKYNGNYFDSSWELAWMIVNTEQNVPFSRNTKSFTYAFDGKMKRYYPDFVQGDTYFEIKNFNTPEFQAKLKYFPYNIKVLFRKDIEPYLIYCKTKYGKRFWEPYSNKILPL